MNKFEIVSKLRDLAREIENTNVAPLDLDGDPKPLDELLTDLREEFGSITYMLRVSAMYRGWEVEHRLDTAGIGSEYAKGPTLQAAVDRLHEMMRPEPTITADNLGEFVPTLTAETPNY